MTTLRAPVAYAIAAVVGAVCWLGISELTHRREAWDSDLYFSWSLPSVALVVGGLAFFAPERSWRWAFTPFGAQAVVATIQNPGANLLPLGLLVFAFYGALCLIPAKLGVALRRRLEPPQPISRTDQS
jgi:peptidoglycan/LPS O-acetylase OafA/YrhL